MTETLLGRAEHDTAPAGDAAFARWLAARAGELLLRLRGELARWRPADKLLSEEGADDLSRVDAERVWIVDPLDGTREYGEEGRADWAVHIALWQCMNGIGRLAAAAVALPAQHR